MPAHKGVEPFSRFWTVNYNVLVQSAGIAAGTFLSRPRSIVFGSQVEAQAAYDQLVSLVSFPLKAGNPAAGTIQNPFLEKFYNKKSFILTWTNEHIAFVRTSN